MTTAQRESIVQRVGRILDERVSLVRWFRQNACLRHGLPFEENSELRVVVDGSPGPPGKDADPEAVTKAVLAKIQAVDKVQPATPASRAIPGWAKTAIAVAVAAAGGYGVNEWRKPAEPPEIASPDSGSLLQDLEDRGFHLPE